MALLWFAIGFLVGAGVVILGLSLFTFGMAAGEKKAKQATGMDDGEVK